ncbi:MAG: UDP-N-acetylglucosamine--N-acetylmuramyl-(pentapeptide) pyrophosphoryl-undecaprenol N-acetylglucosamine transferase [Candidatus Paceibacterota bacterium]|jgi:UDP-N-acetylglucosamine--N-acetylmuramyl-(pentapeptide) pyrophosphoryl-undecaprenol N-acetylglucosamine transferase
MKILFTGGGTGGHFYPIIAIAQEIRKLATAEKLVEPELLFMSNGPYNQQVLFENNIKFVPVSAGKLRRDKAPLSLIKNFLGLFQTLFGSISALLKVFSLYPDIVVGKGGYASFPALLAARILRIPVIIHESDSHPGRVNLWAGKFAVRVALSYPEAVKYFPADKTAVTGNPLRQEIMTPVKVGAHEFLHLDKTVPVIFVIGGSLGATKINEVILDVLPQLLAKYQIIHQVGKNNFEETRKRANFLLENNPHRDRYKIFDYLNASAMRMTAGASSLVITRAGSALFEIANWGLPAIIIPIPEEISHDQRLNAFTYARSGGAVVIEQKNLAPSIILSEIDRIMSNDQLREEMIKGAQSFARPEAAELIAKEIIKLALRHEE